MAATSHPNATPTRLRWWVAFFTVLAMLLSACGDDSAETTSADATDSASDDSDEGASFDEVNRQIASDDSGDSIETAEAMEEEDSGESAVGITSVGDDGADEAASDLGDGGTAPAQNLAQQRGREIIYTASVSVGVDDVAAAGATASQIIADLGGFISSQNTQGGAEPRSTITFKVDPDDFSTALEQLGGIGELRNQTISTDDVTERVVDLESRIEVADLGVQRLREAMENTTTLKDFADLEQLLLNRESDLEVMRGTLRTLRDRIDLATITLTLEQDRVENSIGLFFTVYEGHDAGVSCPGSPSNEIRFEPEDEVTLCFESRNTGDQALRNVTITETVLGIDGPGDLITVFGDVDDLQPGQSVIQAYELTAERDRPLRLGVTATPTDGVSEDPSGPAVRVNGSPVLRVDEDAVDAGFGEGFDAAVGLLAGLWQIARVLAGFIVPMLVLVPFFLLLWWAGRRVLSMRREQRAASIAADRAAAAANTPPPPKAAEPVAASSDEPQESSADESD